jgi:hypothetical protein
MVTLASDTSAVAERIQIQIWRGMPSWRKLELVGQMNAAVRALALSGLRQRFPQASRAELERRLATLTLGAELAVRIYGTLEDAAQ